MSEKRRNKGGRNPKLDPAVFRYTVRFSEEEHNRFLSMFEKSGVYAKSVFLKAHFFGQPFKVLKVDKTLVDYYTKLSDFHAQFRAIGTNYNQVVKDLREKTAAGMMDCKKALTECDGDMEKAVDWLRQKGLSKAAKKAGRATSEGLVGFELAADGKSGVAVEVKCETDFVARLDDFKTLAHEIAMQIAAMSPKYVSEADIPAEEMERVKAELMASESLASKPEEMREKIVEGQLKKHFAEQVLMSQAYILDDSKTVEQHVKEAIAKLGENIVIRQFKRIELGVSE